MIRYLTLAATVFLLSANAHADLSACVDQYDMREDSVAASVALGCFRDVIKNSRNDDISTYRDAIEYALQTAAWQARTGATDEKRSLAVATGLDLAADAIQTISASGLGYYWSGVFQLARCQTFDPRLQKQCLQEATPSAITVLSRAWNIEPDLHGFGPARVLGAIARNAVFPDTQAAKKFTGEAYESAPNFSANTIEAAKLLIAIKDPARARKILEEFLSASCRSMDPSRIPECNLDRAEANQLLRRFR